MNWRVVVSILMLAAATSPVAADPWKDESGHGRRGREWKQEFHDGNCKVERKWEKDGGYKEERKCSRLPEGVIAGAPPLVYREAPPLPGPRAVPERPPMDDRPWLREAPRREAPQEGWQNPR